MARRRSAQRQTNEKKDDRQDEQLDGFDVDDGAQTVPVRETVAEPEASTDQPYRPPSECDAEELRRIYKTPDPQFCEQCSIKLESHIRATQRDTKGPIATYECPECGDTWKVGRRYFVRPNFEMTSSQNHAAAREEMKRDRES